MFQSVYKVGYRYIHTVFYWNKNNMFKLAFFMFQKYESIQVLVGFICYCVGSLDYCTARMTVSTMCGWIGCINCNFLRKLQFSVMGFLFKKILIASGNRLWFNLFFDFYLNLFFCVLIIQMVLWLIIFFLRARLIDSLKHSIFFTTFPF